MLSRMLVVIAISLTMGLTACGPPPLAEAKPIALPGAFSAAGEQGIPAEWWTVLNDPALDGLIEKALAGNFSLKAAWARMDQARAAAGATGADLLPTLSAEGTAGRSISIADISGANTRTYTTTLSGGIRAGYELDLWGRMRSTRDAALLDTEASREDLQAAAMTLASDVAAVWYRLIEARAQSALLGEQLVTNMNSRKLVMARFEQGQADAADILQLRQTIEALRGDQSLARARTELLAHQLAVLCGQSPTAPAASSSGTFPVLPQLPSTGVPAGLVNRRPDTRSSFLRLRAADERAAAAVAARFPSLSFSARVETSADSLGTVFDNWFGNLAANVLVPLFQGGRLKAEAQRRRGGAWEALNTYRAAVLRALQEVEDNLTRENEQHNYIASLQKQEALSRQVIRQTQTGFEQGSTDYLRVLAAIRSHQRLERSLLAARLDLILYRIDLYRALGGGWKLARPAQTADEEGQ